MDALDALKLTEGDTTVKTALEQSGLDQAAFLTIFLAQLENQDPLNPQSSDQLASQLAQFSQLEQSIRSMTELVGINERLDRLIDASGSESSFGLDPVALLGHEVDIGFRLPAFGSSQALRMELDDASTSLRIQVNDLNGDALGLAEIMGTSEDGETIDLPAGTYQLIFDNQEPRLIVPDGTESSIRFFTLHEGTNQIDPGSPPLSFDPDRTYQFSVTADGLTRGVYTPQTNSTGSVDAIRIVDGLPILSVSGVDVDPSQILRIR